MKHNRVWARNGCATDRRLSSRALPEWKLISSEQAKEVLGVKGHELRALAQIELVDQRWTDGRRQTGVRVPTFLLERGLGVPSSVAR